MPCVPSGRPAREIRTSFKRDVPAAAGNADTVIDHRAMVAGRAIHRPQAGKPKAARRRPDWAWEAGRATTGHLRPADALRQRLRRSRRNAASLARAVGIQRMGGEYAHADQGEDSGWELDHWPASRSWFQMRSKKNCMLAVPVFLTTTYAALCFRMFSSARENGFVGTLAQLNDDNFAAGVHAFCDTSGVIRSCWKPSYCCWAWARAPWSSLPSGASICSGCAVAEDRVLVRRGPLLRVAQARGCHVRVRWPIPVPR